MRRMWIVAGGICALMVAGVLFYLFRPDTLFYDTMVSEAFPTSMPVARAAAQQAPPATPRPTASPRPTMAPVTPTPDIKPTAEPTVEPTVEPTLEPTLEPTPEPTAVPPPAEPIVLSSGYFHPVEHPGQGLATIYQLPDGTRILRLTEFDMFNGPDLYVYLVAAPDAYDHATVKNAGFYSLGRLKGTVGDQNYVIPADVDLSVFRSVSVWCQRFGVNFATAPLQ